MVANKSIGLEQSHYRYFKTNPKKIKDIRRISEFYNHAKRLITKVEVIFRKISSSKKECRGWSNYQCKSQVNRKNTDH